MPAGLYQVLSHEVLGVIDVGRFNQALPPWQDQCPADLSELRPAAALPQKRQSATMPAPAVLRAHHHYPLHWHNLREELLEQHPESRPKYGRQVDILVAVSRMRMRDVGGGRDRHLSVSLILRLSL
jgi:hypothetical protein